MPTTKRAALKRTVTVVLGTAFWGAVLFASAGRIDWLRGWICLALYFGGVLAAFVVMRIANPELIAARGTKHADTKPFDKVFAAVYAPMMFVLPVVAGLDAGRFGWSRMGPLTLYAGAVLLILGTIPVLSSVAVNRYLETTVRIQEDRDHQVVRSGAYRFVRHPMYVGVILQFIALPLMLGSKWALVPAGVIALLFVIRTALEDRTLRSEFGWLSAVRRRNALSSGAGDLVDSRYGKDP
jgi:protein-S-isoprenylcysteine O-methyltransferase Ste14